MPTEEFSPDLSTLQDDYQILTELRRSANARAFLARHLKLNRDVTLTIVRVPPGGDRNTLSLFAADARALAAMRHPNVIPVIEGRWLKDGTFAIARARVRGSTLDQVVDVVGAMPAARVASALEQVYGAITWARANGIGHRHVSGDAIVFQQGSGRALLELDPPPNAAGGVSDACDDARTVGRLAYEMLSGRRADDPAARPLAEARPELSAEVVRETEALMRCERTGPARDAAMLITLLGGSPERALTIPVPRESGPTAATPIGLADDAVVVAKHGMSFNARLLSAIAVVAIIAVLGILLLKRHVPLEKLAASGAGDTTDRAAGEVVLPKPLPDTYSVVAPTIITPAAPVVPSTQDSLINPPVTPPARRPAPPETRRSEPPIGVRPSTLPPVAAPTPRDSTSSGDICDSSDAGDQHTCLINQIETNDKELNATYRRVVAGLRRQAGAQEGDPDPPTVDDLRAAQRRWLDGRDATCRDVGEGVLYARMRARCYGEQAAARTRELATILAAIPPA